MKQSFSFKGHTFIKRTLIVNNNNILIEVTDPKQNIEVYKKYLNMMKNKPLQTTYVIH